MGGIVSIGQIVQGGAHLKSNNSKFAFISHADEDKPRLGWILEAFVKNRIPFWIDRPEELDPLLRTLGVGRIEFGRDW